MNAEQFARAIKYAVKRIVETLESWNAPWLPRDKGSPEQAEAELFQQAFGFQPNARGARLMQAWASGADIDAQEDEAELVKLGRASRSTLIDCGGSTLAKNVLATLGIDADEGSQLFGDLSVEMGRLTNSALLIAKLDRLSRNAAFLLTLQESGARFVACDLPDMNETVVGILAVVAQAERKAISERTKAALAHAKTRGVKLGGPNLQPGTRASARRASRAAQVVARARAEELRDVIEDARKRGCESLRQYAEHLNGLGIATPRGGHWAAASVSRLMVQLAN